MEYSLAGFLALLLQLCLQLQYVHGLSTHYPPIKRVEHVSKVEIKVLPRQRFFRADNSNPFGASDFWRRSLDPAAYDLRSDDSFLMSMAIPNHWKDSQGSPHINPQETRFTLFLQPTVDLLHPQARMSYESSDSRDGQSVTRTVSIAHEEVLAYSGWVIKQSAVESWWEEQKRLKESGTYYHPSTDHRNHDPRVIGWARVLIHETRGMRDSEDLENLIWEGSFEARGQLWHIKTFDSYNLIRRPTDHSPERWHSHPSGGLIAWEEAVDDSTHQSASDGSTSHLQKRQSIDSMSGSMGNIDFLGSIGSTDGCPSTRKIVYMGIAADCTYISKYGSANAARLAILNNLNTVSALYERSFNISLAVVELKIQDIKCPAHPTPDVPWNIGCPDSGPDGLSLDRRLSAFSQWRGQKGGSDGAGLWHLMTACPNGQEVGVAWLGTLCKVNSDQQASNGLNELARAPSSGQVTSGTGVTSANPSEWQVMAHEIGHNFGAIHDCSSGCTSANSCCPYSKSRCDPDNDYIMTATSSRPTSSFSPCSIGNVCSNLKAGAATHMDTSCLSEPGAHRNISLNQCGNGIIDPGEDCDPGDTPSPCCQWGVCKFTPQAVCDPTHSPCCAPSCQFSPYGTICRPVIDPVCDRAEMCSGKNAECPADSFAQNGLSCGASGAGLSCAAGKCTSRDQQCQAQDPKLGLKQACDPEASMDCRIACKDPNQPNQCVVLEAKFVEGSPCGCGGFCSATGTCVGGDQAGCGNQWREVSHDSV
ncbi:hypothetical protein PGT21_002103 [Puccinia graminis f. sp. tritici]|uniref:Disintegrin and metalloproteinase domain-containing protein B n=1 Tax=Puccinia graminis f. sp. tritici TaxID=56615 RepID=A0A5B0Q203_PUCGR|nr:hypothetical protein PGT21_002103 [Puccinia graminis f. sp. tritici]KAA1127892.1 hypothetical protein PGTUg99_006233 [Puccinia graminis f. sp. tritici]